jgi:hypothetical protein
MQILVGSRSLTFPAVSFPGEFHSSRNSSLPLNSPLHATEEEPGQGLSFIAFTTERDDPV